MTSSFLNKLSVFPGVQRWLTHTTFTYVFLRKCQIVRKRRNWWRSWWNRESSSHPCLTRSVMTILSAKVTASYHQTKPYWLNSCHNPVFSRSSHLCLWSRFDSICVYANVLIYIFTFTNKVRGGSLTRLYKVLWWSISTGMWNVYSLSSPLLHCMLSICAIFI